MATSKKKPSRRRKPAARRQKFSTASKARAQLEGVAAAQLRYRRAKRQNAKDEIDALDAEVEGIIIESIEKSQQALKNALQTVRRPEDLDGFD